MSTAASSSAPATPATVPSPDGVQVLHLNLSSTFGVVFWGTPLSLLHDEALLVRLQSDSRRFFINILFSMHDLQHLSSRPRMCIPNIL